MEACVLACRLLAREGHRSGACVCAGDNPLVARVCAGVASTRSLAFAARLAPALAHLALLGWRLE